MAIWQDGYATANGWADSKVQVSLNFANAHAHVPGAARLARAAAEGEGADAARHVRPGAGRHRHARGGRARQATAAVARGRAALAGRPQRPARAVRAVPR